MNRYDVGLMLFVFLIGITISLASNGSGAIIVVDDDVGTWADYQNIQDAIDNATEGNDTIVVYNGTYSGHITVDKTLDLIGNGSMNTTVDCQYQYSVWLKSDWINFSGFRVIKSHSAGKAINIESNHNRIFQCNISENAYGISSYQQHNSTIFDNIFTSNRQSCIDFSQEDNMTIRDNFFTSTRGGSIRIGTDSINCIVENNTAVNNPAGYASIAGDYGLVQGNYFFNNSGGMSIGGEWNIVTNNTCDFNEGRGLGVGGSNNTLRDNICTNNSWGGESGGIYISGVHNFINNNTCKWNTNGMQINSGQYNYVRDNDCSYNNNSGIWIRYWTLKNYIENNNCSNNGINGIHIKSEFTYHAEKNLIQNNNCSDNGANGIWIDITVKSNFLVNNDCSNNIKGINITSSSNAELDSNICEKNEYGIYLFEADLNLIYKNKCDWNNDSGLYIRNSEGNSILSNLISNNTIRGIVSFIADFNNISYNSVLNNLDKGISIIESSNNTISGNEISNSDLSGLSFGQDSNFNNISWNNITFCWPGVSFFDVENNHLFNNNITYNKAGVSLSNSDWNLLEFNNCSNNNNSGVSINIAKNNTLTNNTIMHNKVGMGFAGLTYDNEIHYNTIVQNSQYGASAENISKDADVTLNWWGTGSGPYHTTNNPNGMGDNVSDYVIFDPWLPHAVVVSINPNPALQGENIQFKARGITFGDTVQYSWYSDIDGVLYNGTSSSFTDMPSNGTHNITLEVLTTVGGWSKGTHATMMVNGEPQAFIEQVEPNDVLEGEIISFNGSWIDDSGIDRFVWRSDIDGEFYDGSSDSISYGNLSNGTHTISLRVRDDLGEWSDWATAELPVMVNGIPQARIQSIAPDETNEEILITFIGEGIDNGDIVRYRWTSDIDGLLYNGSNDSFSFTTLSNGSHNISLDVVDDMGVWSSKAKAQVYVNGIPICQIIDISPASAPSGEAIEFSGLGIDDISVVRYLWNSSLDGTIYDGSNSTFSVSTLSNGSHNITFNSQDNHGVWGLQQYSTVIVSGIPVAVIIEISPNSSVEGDNVSFTGYGIDDIAIDHYHWQSDIDEELYNGSNPSFVVKSLSNGTHNISLRVMNSFGVWSNWTNQTVTVNGRPRGFILTVDPNPLPLGDQLALRARGLDDISIERYVWSTTTDNEIANGTTENLTVEGLSEGATTLYLKVLDDKGVWSYSDLISLVVNQLPRVTIGLPLNRSIVSGEVNVNGTMTDTFGTTYYVQISIDYGEWITVTGTNTWFYDLDTADLENAQHLIRLRAYDGYHFSKVVSITIEVENEISEPDGGNDSSDNSLVMVAVLGIIIGILVSIVGYFIFKSKH